jgi:hypothetical protein
LGRRLVSPPVPASLVLRAAAAFEAAHPWAFPG